MIRVLLAGVLAAGCVRDAPVAAEAGEPLPLLTAEQTSRFHAGKALFNKVYTPDEGLGPAFNENQCSACHTSPAAGGTTGFERITKASRSATNGCDLLSAHGGENVRTQTTPLLRALGVQREDVPAAATDTALFLPPFLFGLGLVEAIPDAAILAHADPDDRNGDGISGRAAVSPNGRVMRFGRKADVTRLEQFTRSALLHEMGLTSAADGTDRVGGRLPPAGTDPAPDPEVDSLSVALLTDFVRYLAPVAAVTARSPEQADSIERGRRTFTRLGCAECHTPTMRTGPSAVAALDRRTVQLYSDLLLHDMGPALRTVCAAAAEPQELRTAILSGLQHRSMFLHDGRAFDLREAILAHDGEARRAREEFARLGWMAQEYVVIFLRSL